MGIRPGFRPPPLPAPRVGRATIEVDLELVTPVLGGGPVARELDEVDYFRVPTIRGHLRFWWRALNRTARTAEELFAAERALWGGVTGEGETGGRSLVDVRVDVRGRTPVDDSSVEPYPRAGLPATPGAYALFPARGERGGPSAPRRPPGSRFRLTVLCPREHEADVRKALCAWVIFGGYGSRTRRGLGSFTVVGTDAERWLPAAPTREAVMERLGRDVFDEVPGIGASDRPRLGGADLVCGEVTEDAVAAWTEALGWLSDFRQSPSARAREPGDGRRPGRSNWPEPDKVRRLVRGDTDHPPRHDRRAVWPRAAFGLPIVARFQRKARDGGRLAEPCTSFQLRWKGEHDEKGDRLASPLIVKAMPLADGRFAPCALWLDRSFPRGGKVVLEADGRPVRGSEAAFDELVASDEDRECTFQPLLQGLGAPAGRRLRTAFMTWVREQRGANRA